MDKNGIHIVDRGRGPQLSSCRITVQDLVPYLQQQFTIEQIQDIMPVLTVEEIQAVAGYVRSNYDAVMEQDRRIRERAASRQKPPDVEENEHSERLERLNTARRLIRQREQARDPAAR